MVLLLIATPPATRFSRARKSKNNIITALSSAPQAAMAREGTRSATGNSRPRVFPTVDTAPATTRKKATKPKKKAVPAVKASKPAGVTKKKAPAKKVEPKKVCQHVRGRRRRGPARFAYVYKL
jgi:hypothetical protein